MLLDHVIVSRKSHRSDRAYDIIMSNVSVVNYLFDEGANGDELCDEALGSYHVDFYEVQVSNGGIDQFVHNSGWDPFVIGHVAKGLELMGATRHAELFARVQQVMDSLSDEERAAIWDDGVFGDDRVTAFDALTDEFFELNEEEKLETLNSAFLRGLPNLEVVRRRDLEERLDGIIATIPDLEQRLAERAEQAEANKPRFARVIDAICADRGWELETITAGDPTATYDGQQVIGWHFLTDDGHHWMIDLGDRAVVYDTDDNEIGSVDVSAVPEE